MPSFNVSFRLLGIEAQSKSAAKRAAEERLQSLGESRWQVIKVEPAPSPLPVRRATSRIRSKPLTGAFGPLLLLGAFAWAFWFYWLLVE